MNTNQKARQNDLISASDGNFGSTFTYRGQEGRPIESMMDSDFYDTVKTRLAPSDVIRLMEFKNKKVTASIDLIVVSRTPDMAMKLDIRPYNGSEIVRYSEVDEEVVSIPETEPDIKFISGNGQVERDKLSGTYSVKDDKGKVVLVTEKKNLAHAVARGDEPIPVDTEPAAEFTAA